MRGRRPQWQPPLRLLLAALLLAHLCAGLVEKGGLKLEWRRYIHEFKTEPYFNPPKITILNMTADRSKLAPGYIFVDPRGIELHKSAPLIVDNDGNVVYWGIRNVRKASGRVQNVHVCDYMGSKGTHLCWSDVQTQGVGGVRAVNRFFDSTYTQVGMDYRVAGHFKSPNPHEFNTVNDGYSFTQAVYEKRRYDLSPYGGPKAGWYMECCFQEVAVSSGKELFRWCALDHFPIWQTMIYMFMGKNARGKGNMTFPAAGTGVQTDVWDYLHLNAVDRNEEGDYLISARHWDALIKVAGPDARKRHGIKPGTVMWQLGGRSSSFDMPQDAKFGLQHHARFVSTGANESLVSVFNNLGPSTPGVKISDGRVLRVNNVTLKADVERKYVTPSNQRSAAQGSMNVLPNGNALVGWGSHPTYSEFAEDGELLLHARFGRAPRYTEKAYRAYKFPWVGRPSWPPRLLAYSLTCRDSPVVAYASWNGATEHRYWRFSISTSSLAGPWFEVGTFPKQGFETGVVLTEQGSVISTLATYIPFVAVEALDEFKMPLNNSRTVSATFVPRKNLLDDLKCDFAGCTEPHFFDYGPAFNQAGLCRTSRRSNFFALAVVILLIETLDLLWRRLCASMMRLPAVPHRGPIKIG